MAHFGCRFGFTLRTDRIHFEDKFISLRVNFDIASMHSEITSKSLGCQLVLCQPRIESILVSLRFPFEFVSCCLSCDSEFTTISFRVHIRSHSLRFHLCFASVSPGAHVDFTSNSLCLYFDICWMPLRCSVAISCPLCFRSGFISISRRCHFASAWIALRRRVDCTSSAFAALQNVSSVGSILWHPG